jgi:hypothetical protein
MINLKEHAGTLEIILIDPDEFPLMVDVWEEMFGIDIEEGPQMGLVDISEKEGIWFDMSQLNLDDPKKHQDANLEALQLWVDQIMAVSFYFLLYSRFTVNNSYFPLFSGCNFTGWFVSFFIPIYRCISPLISPIKLINLYSDDDDDEPPPPPPAKSAPPKKAKKEL